MTRRTLAIAILISLVSCTPDSGRPSTLEAKQSPDAPVPDVPMPYRTESAEGKHGLELEISAPEATVGGQRFDITYEVADDEGAIRGVEIDWGDGKTWGALPMDLVCSAIAGKPKPKEGAGSERKEMSHAYREAGVYEVTVSAYTGGCFTHWDRASVSAEIKVVVGGAASNGPLDPRAKIGHAYYTDGDPSVLVSDLGGYDEDGFVNRIDIDWGDGSTETLERPVSECEDVDGGWPGGWFSEPTEHTYEAPGDYLVKVEAVSVGCDGGSPQTDSAQRTLEFPPVQGS